MNHIWKQKAKCKSCNGTGIYRGFGEHGKVGVVCHNCKGTGQMEFKVEWEDFEGRARMNDLKRVIEINPGITVSEDPKYGGMEYEDWFQGKPFPPRSENRNYVCPAWWYHGELKPDWPECRVASCFSSCPNFKKKHKCWAKWDEEQKTKAKKAR